MAETLARADAAPLLEVRGIDVYYGHVQALRGVSLEIYPGELVALVGANGAGKTTTLRTISGLLRPVVGTVTLDGQRIDRLPPEKIVALGVSHLPEGRGIFPTLTVEENLQMGYYAKRRDRGGLRRGVEQSVALFPRLGERMKQAAGTMSGGEQQMLALARALLSGPRLLMIDELSLGLAPVVVQMLFERLREINDQGTTVLLVEQYVNLALQVADRAYVLEKGAVSVSGDAATMASESEAVRSSYLGGSGNTEPSPPARDDAATVELVATAPPTKRASSRPAPASRPGSQPAKRVSRTAPAKKTATKKTAAKKTAAAKKKTTKTSS